MATATPVHPAGNPEPAPGGSPIRATPVSGMPTGLPPPPPSATPAAAPGMQTSDPDDSLASHLEAGMRKQQAAPPAPKGTKTTSPLKQPDAKPAPKPSTPTEPDDDAPPSSPPSNLLESLERSGKEPLKLEPLPKEEPEIPPGTPESDPSAYTMEDAQREADELLKHPHVSVKTKRTIERFRAEAIEAKQKLQSATKTAPDELTPDKLPEEIQQQLRERNAMMWERNAENLPEVKAFNDRIAGEDSAILAIVGKYFNPAAVELIKQAGGFDKFVESNPGSETTPGGYEQIEAKIPKFEMRNIELRRQERLRLEGEKRTFVESGKTKAAQILNAENTKASAASAEDKAVVEGFLANLKSKEPLLQEPKLPENATEQQRADHATNLKSQQQLMGLAQAILSDNTAKGRVNAVQIALNGLRAFGEREVMRVQLEWYKNRYEKLRSATPGNPARQGARGEAPKEGKQKFDAETTPADALAAQVAKMAGQR